jgi:hypothetical protein
MTIATMLILLMKITSSITWIRNHILQMHDEYDELRRINDDIYTQGLRITTSVDEIGDDPNAEKAPELDDDPNFSDMGDCND